MVVAIGSETIFGIFGLFIYKSKQNCLHNTRRKDIQLQHSCTNYIPLVPLVDNTLIGCVETRRTKSRAVNVISGLAAAAILFQLSAEKFHQMYVYSTTIKPGVSIGHNILLKTRSYNTNIIYTIILIKSVGVSKLQVAIVLDRLGICLSQSVGID